MSTQEAAVKIVGLIVIGAVGIAFFRSLTSHRA